MKTLWTKRDKDAARRKKTDSCDEHELVTVCKGDIISSYGHEDNGRESCSLDDMLGPGSTVA